MLPLIPRRKISANSRLYRFLPCIELCIDTGWLRAHFLVSRMAGGPAIAGEELHDGISAQLWERHTHSAHHQPYPQQREVCHLDFPHRRSTPFWLSSAREPAGSIILPHCNPNVTISSVAQRGGMPDTAKSDLICRNAFIRNPASAAERHWACQSGGLVYTVCK